MCVCVCVCVCVCLLCVCLCEWVKLGEGGGKATMTAIVLKDFLPSTLHVSVCGRLYVCVDACVWMRVCVCVCVCVCVFYLQVDYSLLFYLGSVPIFISFFVVTFLTHWGNWDPVLVGLKKLLHLICRRRIVQRLVYTVCVCVLCVVCVACVCVIYVCVWCACVHVCVCVCVCVCVFS